MTFLGFIFGAQVLLVSPFVMNVACPGDIGCYSAKTQTIMIDNTLQGDTLKFAVYHEIGHLLYDNGTPNEDTANTFAHKFMPRGYVYNPVD